LLLIDNSLSTENRRIIIYQFKIASSNQRSIQAWDTIFEWDIGRQVFEELDGVEC